MWPLLFLALGQVSRTVAQNCTLGESPFETIRTPEDINEIVQNCSILDGRLSIGIDYSGPFHVPNLINITGALRSVEEGSRDALGITSFDMPDLEGVLDIDLYWMPDLTEWSTPKLKKADLFLLVPTNIPLEFPALESADYIDIATNASKVSFPALKTVGAFGIGSFGNWDTTAVTAMNVSVPSLQSAGKVLISTNASSVSLPNLTSIVGGNTYANSYSEFQLAGTTVSVDLPKLGIVDGGLAFIGNISSLSLPRLRKVTGAFQMTAYEPLSLDLPLEEVDSIYLSGLIESVHFPSLRSWRRFSVDSDSYIDCEDLERRLNETLDAPPGEFECLSPGPRRPDSDSAEDVAGRFAKGGIGAIVAVASVVGFILLC
ncbi:hypothetical protein BJX63DRAFT_400615 [Aspergillus granulosus]|uniref:Protein ecm33 n=1 Tax=Aspergillus granulosus TaxID=176169 RepID=A0ABR4H814_9EURO